MTADEPQSLLVMVYFWFGPIPKYFPFWLDTCRKNRGVKFLVFSDQDLPDQDNVCFVKISQDEVIERYSKGAGHKIQNVIPHKMTDYRPFIGLSFPEYIKNYKYWGYSDVDVLYGDLKIVTDILQEEKFDLISPGPHTMGHFSVFKNSKSVNELPLKFEDLENRLNNQMTTFMDEGGVTDLAKKLGGFKFAFFDYFKSKYGIADYQASSTIRPLGEIKNIKFPWVFKRDSGGLHLLVNGSWEFILYLHFMGMKSDYLWSNEVDKDRYFFSPLGVSRDNEKSNTVVVFKYAMLHWRAYFYNLARRFVPASLVSSYRKKKVGAKGR